MYVNFARPLVEVAEIFASRVKIRLADLDLTHQAFANLIGLQRATVSKYLQGKTTPGADLVRSWAKILKVSSSWLLGEEPLEDAVPIGKSPIELARGILPVIGIDPVRQKLIERLITADDDEIDVLLATSFLGRGVDIANKGKRTAG